MTSNLSYKGKVTLKTIRNNKILKTVVHNSGTNNLFELILKALVGQDVKNSLPTKINIRTGEESPNESVLSYGGSYVTRNFVKEENGVAARFSTNIGKYSAAKGAIWLTLEDDNGNILAKVNTSTGIPIGNTVADLSSGTQLLVIWDVTIDNVETTNSNEESE